MYDMITTGSCTVDVFLGTEARERKGKIEYPVGTKIVVNDVNFETGGCGMNVAVGLKRLGCSAAFLGKYGDDANGKMISSALKKEGVPFIGPPGKGISGYSVILDSVKHDRTILHYKGANNDLKPSDVSKQPLNTRWLYMANHVGDSFKVELLLADIAKARGIKVAFNPGVSQCEKGERYLRKILDVTNVLILNRDEAMALSGKRKEKSIIKALNSMGPSIICITNGSKETLCYNGDKLYRIYPHKVKIVERTGAGDAFSSGFLAGIIKGWGIEKSLQLGLANSESVIKYVGSLNKLLTQKEAAAIIRRNPGKITRHVMA